MIDNFSYLENKVSRDTFKIPKKRYTIKMTNKKVATENNRQTMHITLSHHKYCL